MTIVIVREGDFWIFRGAYEDRHVFKAAGARWNPDRKCWWSDRAEIAARIGSPEAVAAVNRDRGIAHENAKNSLLASRAVDAAIEIPIGEKARAKGFDYLPYQKAGVAYGLERKDVLYGDEMGLGKTLEIIGIINADTSIRTVLIVCPASLKINWIRECELWLARPMSIAIANGGSFPETDCVIVNYDILLKHDAAIKARGWDMVACDEVHMAKNKKAQRTQAIFGKWDKDTRSWAIAPLKARRRVFASGTPILNKPAELWTLVHALDPKGLGANWRTFHVRYCNGHQTDWGWDVSGASNLPELNTKLRALFMIRRLKNEVLAELPPKRRQLIALEPSAKARALIKRQSKLVERVEGAKEALLKSKATSDPKAYEQAVAALQDASGAEFEEMSQLRHDIGLVKLPQVIEHIRDALDGGVEKIVVFAWHRDVIEALTEAFKADGAVRLYGGDSAADKQAAVDRFQNDPSCRVFIGSIRAAGVGITLTASSHVCFAEADWTPGWNQQAEDRLHRIGQRNNVLVQHIELDGSLDARIAQVNIEKADIADQALDAKGAPLAAPVLMVSAPAEPLQAPQKPAEAARGNGQGDYTADQVQAVHEALRLLAGCDTDRAFEQNGVGFNRLDGEFGHSLAESPRLSQRQARAGAALLFKYRRQIGEELLARIKGAPLGE